MAVYDKLSLISKININITVNLFIPNTYFRFKNKIYNQCFGEYMISTVSSIIATIVLYFILNI